MTRALEEARASSINSSMPAPFRATTSAPSSFFMSPTVRV